MTPDNTGEPVFWWLNIYLREESQRAEEFRIFTVNKSVTADGSLLSPTGDVEGINLHLIFTNKWLRQITYKWLRHCVHLYA